MKKTNFGFFQSLEVKQKKETMPDSYNWFPLCSQNIEGWLKIFYLMAYSQIFLNLLRGDYQFFLHILINYHQFGYKQESFRLVPFSPFFGCFFFYWRFALLRTWLYFFQEHKSLAWKRHFHKEHNHLLWND